MHLDNITSLSCLPPGTQRHDIVFAPYDLLKLPTAGPTITTAIEAEAERRARTLLAHQLRTDGPEQTMNWQSYIGPILLDAQHDLVVVVYLTRTPPG